jgi:hypothetical protein
MKYRKFADNLKQQLVSEEQLCSLELVTCYLINDELKTILMYRLFYKQYSKTITTIGRGGL